MKRSDDFENEDFSAAEVELTAQDLLDLSPLPIASSGDDKAAARVASVMPLRAPMVQSAPIESAVLAERAVKPQAEPKPQPKSEPKQEPKSEAAKTKRSSFATACIFAGVIAVAACVMVVFSKEAFSERKLSSPHTRSTIPAAPDPYVEEEPLPVEEQPVLVENPFDESEVFELPAGTTKAEARAYVEEVLLKRAAERQAFIQTSAKR